VLGLVDDPLEALVALHLQPAGAARGVHGEGQLGVVPRRARRRRQADNLGHESIVGWPPMMLREGRS
jgi:hypothetical protein